MDNLKEFMKKNIESDFKKFYIKGFTAGYRVCYSNIYKKISSMTSAKEIKEFIKNEADKIKIDGE